MVTGPEGFFSDEGEAEPASEWLEAGIPAFRLRSACTHYELEKLIFTDPERDALIIRARFRPLIGRLADYRLFVCLKPHISEQAKLDEGKATTINAMDFLVADAPGKAVAMASSRAWRIRDAGTVAEFDPANELRLHGHLTQERGQRRGGPLILIGEIGLPADEGEFDLALGFGACAQAASLQARCALHQDLERAQTAYVEGWRTYQRSLWTGGGKHGHEFLYRCSAAVLRTHHGKDFPGAVVASLSIPWGPTRTDPDEAAYHLLWSRDLVEIAGAFLAMGDGLAVRRALEFLEGTQRDDGHWAQNMWLDGSSHWTGVQLDETALPILLVELAWRHGAIDGGDVRRYWPMIRKAANYLVEAGPATPMDRWEQNAGLAISTLATEIAGLVTAAHIADFIGQGVWAENWRKTAHAWNTALDQTNYVSGTELARECGVEGYYFWIRPPEDSATRDPADPQICLAHHSEEDRYHSAREIVSPDALALVRFGLRPAHDPRILNTIKAIDHALRRDTPKGPAWRRYCGDAYGENEDGSPFSKTGIGRAWPLLTGERAHYEIAAGNLPGARELAGVMRTFAGDSGLLPEQVWDEPDLPAQGLRTGGPTGSARPLVWAHAEYIKLLRSLADKRIFDAAPCVCKEFGS